MPKWTKEQDDFLECTYPCSLEKEILKGLNTHSWFAIQHRANRLGIKRLYSGVKPDVQLELRDVEKAYLAGLIDGEGTIDLRGTSISRLGNYVFVTNTDLNLLNWIKKVTGMGRIHLHQKQKGNRQTSYRWTIHKMQEIKALLKLLVPYMITKLPHAEVMLEYIKGRLEKPYSQPLDTQALNLRKRIRELNRHVR